MSVAHLVHSSHIVLQVLPLATLQLMVAVARRNMPGRVEFEFSGDPEDVSRFRSLPADERQSRTLLLGPVPFGIDSVLGRRAQYVTMLRDPVESAIALYYLILSSPDHYLHSSVADGGWTMDDFVNAARPEIDNPMTRWLNPPPPRPVPAGGVTEAMLAVAKRNLAERYIFGITERFDESMLLLGRALGW
jgi:hypothetical protein